LEPARSLNNSTELIPISRQFDVIAVDEVQFLDLKLSSVCEELRSNGIRVILAGLNLDSFGQPFGPLPSLMTIADKKTELAARCEVCGSPAKFTQRLHKSRKQVLLGNKDHYEPRCKDCFQPVTSKIKGKR
jgi:thymidine kinase